MATSRKGADIKGRNALDAPLRRLRDEILDLYLDWREQAAAVADAYASWEGAPAGEEGQCFAAYTAALDATGCHRRPRARAPSGLCDSVPGGSPPPLRTQNRRSYLQNRLRPLQVSGLGPA
jgi:hypothetical protein